MFDKITDCFSKTVPTITDPEQHEDGFSVTALCKNKRIALSNLARIILIDNQRYRPPLIIPATTWLKEHVDGKLKDRTAAFLDNLNYKAAFELTTPTCSIHVCRDGAKIVDTYSDFLGKKYFVFRQLPLPQ